jgi:lipid-binding SYLF domain-containing protein
MSVIILGKRNDSPKFKLIIYMSTTDFRMTACKFDFVFQHSAAKGLYSHNVSINGDKITVLNDKMTATGEYFSSKFTKNRKIH